MDWTHYHLLREITHTERVYTGGWVFSGPPVDVSTDESLPCLVPDTSQRHRLRRSGGRTQTGWHTRALRGVVPEENRLLHGPPLRRLSSKSGTVHVSGTEGKVSPVERPYRWTVTCVTRSRHWVWPKGGKGQSDGVRRWPKRTTVEDLFDEREFSKKS